EVQPKGARKTPNRPVTDRSDVLLGVDTLASVDLGRERQLRDGGLRRTDIFWPIPHRTPASSSQIRLYYAVDQICSVGYKCLSCGYEETRPQTAVTSVG